jgi:hypothetical protein
MKPRINQTLHLERFHMQLIEWEAYEDRKGRQ